MGCRARPGFPLPAEFLRQLPVSTVQAGQGTGTGTGRRIPRRKLLAARSKIFIRGIFLEITPSFILSPPFRGPDTPTINSATINRHLSALTFRVIRELVVILFPPFLPLFYF